jgi:hypothetical protein
MMSKTMKPVKPLTSGRHLSLECGVATVGSSGDYVQQYGDCYNNLLFPRFPVFPGFPGFTVATILRYCSVMIWQLETAETRKSFCSFFNGKARNSFFSIL